MTTADSNGLITRKMLDQAVDTILESVTRLLVGLAAEMNKHFDKIEHRLQKVEKELSSVKDEVKASNARRSNAPSRQEFNELKARVDRSHPLL